MKKTLLIVAAIAAFAAPAYSQILINGLTTDTELNENNTLATATGTALRAGSSTTNGGGRNALFVFQLGDFGAVANPYQSADLQLTLASKNGSFSFNADVYGLGRQSSSTLTIGSGVLETARFNETDTPGLGDTLIQTDFAVPSTGNVTLNTDATGDANLLAFLNTQYAAGAGANQFVVIRVNPDSGGGENPLGYNFASANNVTESFRPLITVTAIPEPGSIALLGLCLGALLIRRRTRRA